MPHLDLKCAIAILSQIDAEFQHNRHKRSVKMREILRAEALSGYSAEELESNYRYLLDQKAIELKVNKDSSKDFPAETFMEVAGRPTRAHHIRRITTIGYQLLDQAKKPKFLEALKSIKVSEVLSSGSNLSAILQALARVLFVLP